MLKDTIKEKLSILAFHKMGQQWTQIQISSYLREVRLCSLVFSLATWGHWIKLDKNIYCKMLMFTS